MVITIAIILVLLLGLFIISSAQTSQVVSTTNRDRLDAGSFTAACVEDQLGWLAEDGGSAERLGRQLQYFWDKTGVQPYVMLLPFSTDWDTADERFDTADSLFESYAGGREDAMLVVYYDAANADEDGWWELVKGLQADSVMDDEATAIFQQQLLRYWSDLNYTVPDAIQNGFYTAADKIMRKTTTLWDVLKAMSVTGMIGTAVVGVIIIMKIKRRHDAEKAAETERILRTPLETSAEDPLLSKYGSGDTDSDSN